MVKHATITNKSIRIRIFVLLLTDYGNKGVEALFEVGEFIVHPGQGVCEVAEIVEAPSPTYKLMPVGQRHPMLISFPVSGEARLRRVLPAAEARALIEDYADMPVDDYTDRSVALEEEHFTKVIKNGTCRESVRVVKTFRQRIAEVRTRHKKPPVVYERILKEAQTRAPSELACAREVDKDAVVAFFESRVGNGAAEDFTS